MPTFHFHPSSKYCKSQRVVYLDGKILEDRLGAIAIECDTNRVSHHRVGNRLWFPKKAITKSPNSNSVYVIAGWFTFDADSYQNKVFDNCVKVL